MFDDRDACYRALTARDPRFDGVFFVGVETTGIYCRPICPARTPKPANCRFFGHAAAAEAAGFRPCLRCRPERAPGSAPVDAREHLARRALAAIERAALGGDPAGEDQAMSAESIARALGVGPRHLRRVVRAAFGRPPRDLARAVRLHTARTLLTQTRLGIAHVALASGFGSERRFRDAWTRRFDEPPSRARAAAGARRARRRAGDTVTLPLAHRGPLAWDDLVRFLSFHTTRGVDHVSADGTYVRTVRLRSARSDHRGWFRVARSTRGVELEVSLGLAPVLGLVVRRVRRLLDLDAHPDLVDDALGRHARLRPLVERRPGLRIPGAFDGFAAAARIVLGQQVSVRGAARLAERFVDAFGEPMDEAEHPPIPGPPRCSPTPEAVAAAGPGAIARAVGLPRTRARCLHALAEAARYEPSLLDGLTADPDSLRRRLLALPGVGPWTAELILLRCAGWPDALPAEDLVLMQRCGMDSPRALRDLARPWSPWRSYATLHLWAAALAERAPLVADDHGTDPA